MSYNTIRISAASLASIALLSIGVLPASAQTLNTSAAVTASPTSVSVSANASMKLSDIITKANSDIAARITALNKLSARVAAITNESATEKANIAAEVQTNISGLTSLQAKIDADTDATTAKTDAATIFGTFRIYALVIPQGWILASSDRIDTISGLMNSLGAKIQARITADQSAGKNVSALTAAYADMQAKMTDANSQSASASAGVSALVPDQGNATVAASNHTALVAARSDTKTATSDLVAARKDITTLLSGLKSLDASASASTNVSNQ
jgi:hypothetical protein